MAKNKRKNLSSIEFDIADVSPLTFNQRRAFGSSNNLIMCGSAGSGKSFIACYLAINALVNKEKKRIVVVRSAVPTRDIGFLPGDANEKTRVYEEPYYSIVAEILQRGDAYGILKQKDLIHFRTTSYLRGITLRNDTIILDECQNMTFHELDSVITRVGHNCRVILCGDFKQADLKKNGMKQFLPILTKMNNPFDIIEFTPEDIVRSDFVKDYIKTKERFDNGQF